MNEIGKFEELVSLAVTRVAELRLEYDDILSGNEAKDYFASGDSLKASKAEVKIIPQIFWRLFRTKPTNHPQSCEACGKVFQRGDMICSLYDLSGKDVRTLNFCPECLLAYMIIMFYKHQKNTKENKERSRNQTDE